MKESNRAASSALIELYEQLRQGALGLCEDADALLSRAMESITQGGIAALIRIYQELLSVSAEVKSIKPQSGSGCTSKVPGELRQEMANILTDIALVNVCKELRT